MAARLKWLSRIVALALVCAVGGFLLFTAQIERRPQPPAERADAIVALTGGGSRIAEAVRLLAQGHGRRLLISGVNRQTSERMLRRLTPRSAKLYDCCIDIGYDALDTVGNAAETQAWVEERGFKRLIVVTSTYHMPRSLTELRRAMPEVELIPHAVVPRDFRMEKWWQHPATVRLLLSEYAKFIPSAARLFAAQMLNGFGAGGTSHADATGMKISDLVPARR